MRYDCYQPCERLKPFVDFFAISEAETEQKYKVIPGTSVVIGFQYKGKLAHLEGSKEIPLSTSGITGLQDRYRVFKNSDNIGTVLVYFKDAGAAVFFQEPIHELFRESVSLDNFMCRSELLILEDQLGEAKDDKERIHWVESFLILRMKQTNPDPLVIAAISIIYQHRGNIRIKELSEQLNISQSPLEKRFRKTAGASPKKFASLVRLKYLLNNYDPQRLLTAFGYDAGFYDQAHFIKEFKNFTGETPEAFFSAE